MYIFVLPTMQILLTSLFDGLCSCSCISILYSILIYFLAEIRQVPPPRRGIFEGRSPEYKIVYSCPRTLPICPQGGGGKVYMGGFEILIFMEVVWCQTIGINEIYIFSSWSSWSIFASRTKVIPLINSYYLIPKFEIHKNLNLSWRVNGG